MSARVHGHLCIFISRSETLQSEPSRGGTGDRQLRSRHRWYQRAPGSQRGRLAGATVLGTFDNGREVVYGVGGGCSQVADEVEGFESLGLELFLGDSRGYQQLTDVRKGNSSSVVGYILSKTQAHHRLRKE